MFTGFVFTTNPCGSEPAREKDSASAGDVLRQPPINDLIKGAAFRPIAHEPRAIPGIRRGETAKGAVLAHRIEVDQRPAILLPEQVMTLEVAMADAFANQLGKQMIQRHQLGFWCIATLNIRRKTLNDVRPRQVLGDQVSPAAQP
ncbi:hypothetical protein D3C87_1153700 [compost metagenome]